MKKQEKGITLIALIITIVVLLILAGVAIKSIQDGGVITKAQSAADSMNKAQIEEKVELVKMELKMESITNKDAEIGVAEFRNRIIGTFQVNDTDNDNVIQVNDKYAVIIRNNLDVKVVETSSALKEKAVLESLRAEYGDWAKEYGIENIYSVDEVVVLYINNDLGLELSSIEEALKLEDVKYGWGTTKEQLYYCIINSSYSSGEEATEQELINYFYEYYSLGDAT